MSLRFFFASFFLSFFCSSGIFAVFPTPYPPPIPFSPFFPPHVCRYIWCPGKVLPFFCFFFLFGPPLNLVLLFSFLSSSPPHFWWKILRCCSKSFPRSRFLPPCSLLYFWRAFFLFLEEPAPTTTPNQFSPLPAIAFSYATGFLPHLRTPIVFSLLVPASLCSSWSFEGMSVV